MNKFIVFIAIFMASCSSICPIDYDAMCIVNGQYTLYGYKSDNPFDPQSIVKVVILDKKDGYVEYCRLIDINKPNEYRAIYTRSCQEFFESTKNN